MEDAHHISNEKRANEALSIMCNGKSETFSTFCGKKRGRKLLNPRNEIRGPALVGHGFYGSTNQVGRGVLKRLNRNTVNRIPGKVAYMRPLNYCLRCRPMISCDIAIQIE